MGGLNTYELPWGHTHPAPGLVPRCCAWAAEARRCRPWLVEWLQRESLRKNGWPWWENGVYMGWKLDIMGNHWDILYSIWIEICSHDDDYDYDVFLTFLDRVGAFSHFFLGVPETFWYGKQFGYFWGYQVHTSQYASKFASKRKPPGTTWYCMEVQHSRTGRRGKPPQRNDQHSKSPLRKRLRRSEGSRGWRETSQGTTLWASLGFDQQKKDHRPSNLNAYSTKFLKWLLISQIRHTKRVFVGMWLWFNHPCSFTALHQGAVKLLCFWSCSVVRKHLSSDIWMM